MHCKDLLELLAAVAVPRNEQGYEAGYEGKSDSGTEHEAGTSTNQGCRSVRNFVILFSVG